MKKELNIAAILDEKPIGTKLWSLVYGECFLNSIDPVDDNIWIKYKGDSYSFNKYGKSFSDGECLLCPSKEMRSWEKFTWKKGDVLNNNCGFQCIFKEWASDDYTKFNGCYSNSRDGYEYVSNADTMKFEKVESYVAYGYIKEIEKKLGGKLNLSTLEIEKEFKDGDVLFVKTKDNEEVFIKKLNPKEKTAYYISYNLTLKDFGCQWCKAVCREQNIKELRLATDSEKQQLFSALAKENKRWNPDTLQIEDLPKKCELKPLDYFMSKFNGDDRSVWYLHQYSFERKGILFYVNEGCMVSDKYTIIPYNDQTKHLLGTTDEWKGGEG